RRLLTAEPDLLTATSIGAPFTAADMQALLATADDSSDASLMRALRDLRKRVILRVLGRDLNGLATLDEVMATVTHLAEIAIRTAVTHLEDDLAANFGEPLSADGSAQKLHVVVFKMRPRCEW